MTNLLLLPLAFVFFVAYKYFFQDDLKEVLKRDLPLSKRNAILETDSIKMPAGGISEILTTKEGLQIRTIRWQSQKQAKGTMLLCQGYSEFIEKYDEVISELLDRNYAVVSFDWRGQGLSSRLIKDPQRGHITSFSDFVIDADLVYEKILLPTMPAPYHIMGHSMGGHLAFRILQEYPERYTKAILCAPFFGWSPNFGAGSMKPTTIIQIAKVMKTLGYGQNYTYGATPPYLEKTLAGQTSDRVRFQKRIAFYKKEAQILMGGPTWNWILESTKSLQLISQQDRINKIKTPILLASGAKDEMVDPNAHHAIAATNDLIKLHDFPESMHEILMEKDTIRLKFWVAFDAFMEE